MDHFPNKVFDVQKPWCYLVFSLPRDLYDWFTPSDWSVYVHIYQTCFPFHFMIQDNNLCYRAGHRSMCSVVLSYIHSPESL